MSPTKNRIVAALGAGAFGQAVNVGIQLLSLPAFLAVWTPAEYGVWLMLSALTAYIAMADVGLVTAVGTEMTMATGRGDRAGANRLFQSALAFMLLVCAVLAVLAMPLIAVLPLEVLKGGDCRAALAALTLTTMLALFGGLADSLFRATGRNATGIMGGNLVRLADWLGCMAGLAWVGSFEAVAIGGLLARAVGLAIMVVLSAKGDHGVLWRLDTACVAEVRRMARPALAFMAFPVANALNFQGTTLLVGHFFGPAALVLFNAYRTMSRLTMQFSAMFCHSVWPELSRLYGQGGAPAVRHLYWRTTFLCSALGVAISLMLYLAAPSILQVWTHGAIEMRPLLLAVMLLAAAVVGVTHMSKVMLIATNQHGQLAIWVMGSAVGALALAALAVGPWGLIGVAMSLVVADVTLGVVGFALAQRSLSGVPVATPA
jgi:O-antigen/teichoic acid export membrane protein